MNETPFSNISLIVISTTFVHCSCHFRLLLVLNVYTVHFTLVQLALRLLPDMYEAVLLCHPHRVISHWEHFRSERHASLMLLPCRDCVYFIISP